MRWYFLLSVLLISFFGCSNPRIILNYKDYYYSYSDLSHRSLSVILPGKIKLEGDCSTAFNYPFRNELHYKQFIMENLQSYLKNYMQLSCVETDTISYIGESSAFSGSDSSTLTSSRDTLTKIKGEYALYIKNIKLFDNKEMEQSKPQYVTLRDGTRFNPYGGGKYDCLVQMNFELWNIKTSKKLFEVEITDNEPFNFLFFGSMVKKTTKKVIQDFVCFMKKQNDK